MVSIGIPRQDSQNVKVITKPQECPQLTKYGILTQLGSAVAGVWRIIFQILRKRSPAQIVANRVAANTLKMTSNDIYCHTKVSTDHDLSVLAQVGLFEDIPSIMNA